MPANAEGLHVIDAQYGEEPAYMEEAAGSIGLFFANPSKAFFIMAAIVPCVLVVLFLLVLLVIKLVRVIKCRRTSKGEQP